MENVRWNGIMRVLEVAHRDRDGLVLWQRFGLGNMLHSSGEQFLLDALFTGGPENPFIPAFYYLGLDNRVTIAEGDTLGSLVGEPSVNGYQRQPVSSTAGFTVSSSSGNFRASSSVVTFLAQGGSWGPVQNIFLSDVADSTGYLIASANLGSPFTMSSGDSVSLRLGMTLRDCPPT